MQRYFVNKIDDNIIFSSEDIHHIAHVMRMRLNDVIEVVMDNHLYEAKIISFNPFKVDIIKSVDQQVELNSKVTLFFALAKGDKMELVIQKACELGVDKIVFLNSKRSVIRLNEADFAKKLIRFNKIAKEASEQSHRLKIPSLEGLYDIKNIPSHLLCDINLVAYECLAKEANPLFDIDDKKSIGFLVGSEGGLEIEEINILKKQGFIPISLGKRILRCETAAIYGLSVISYLLER